MTQAEVFASAEIGCKEAGASLRSSGSHTVSSNARAHAAGCQPRLVPIDEKPADSVHCPRRCSTVRLSGLESTRCLVVVGPTVEVWPAWDGWGKVEAPWATTELTAVVGRDVG